MEKSTKELLGKRIKELRRIRKLSQEQLSTIINIDPKHISRIEVGGSYPSFDTLEKLGKALNVEIKDFLEFEHEFKNQKELKKSLNDLLKDADLEMLKLVVKVVKAMVR